MKLPAFTIIAVFAALAFASMACRAHLLGHRHKPATYPSSAPAPVIERTDGSFSPPPAPVMPVKQGMAPLAYIVEAGGTVRIVDVATGGTIATDDVGPQSIVSVDETAGVRIDGQVFVKGPLPGGRTYQIFLDYQGDHVINHTYINPGRSK